MAALGFVEFLSPEHQSHIITSFRFPESFPAGRAFDFEAFYTALSAKGLCIYPGKVGTLTILPLPQLSPCWTRVE